MKTANHQHFQTYEPINVSAHDFYSEKGVRVSLPLYVDVPTDMRKQLLNLVRTEHEKAAFVESKPSTVTGLVVTTNHSGQMSSIERYLGMNLSVLRGVLFQRGGIAMDLVLRLQEVTGYEVLSPKELTTLFDKRKKFVTGYLKEHPYSPDPIPTI